MSILFVVDRLKDWPLKIPGVEVVSARSYLTEPLENSGRGTKVFNLCRSYRYQSAGYYVSLLAAARGHKPLPSVSTSQDLRYPFLVRLISEDLDRVIQRSLSPLASRSFVLSIYFGRNLANRYERLCLQLFNLFPAPLLRAHFARQDDRWQLRSLSPIAARDIPEEHKDFVIDAARRYFTKGRSKTSRRKNTRYDLAVLQNPDETDRPSNPRALARFARAANALGFRVELIGRDDFGRLAEFDALFIRETTYVNHHTYRFSRRAAAEGLVVIDDPDSILRCTNKVYLAELLGRAKLPTPRTLIVHRDNLERVRRELDFPCILKLPDSSFSAGVVRADDADAFRERASRFLEDSELVIVQEFLPTDFDWRIGILDRKVLYVCKYFMAPAHWQITKRDTGGRIVGDGKVEAIAVDDAPRNVVKTALKAANLIGDGLYGVDMKEKDRRCFVIEINDNPSIDAGCEDALLGDELYARIMQVFLERVERSKEARRG